MRVREGCSKGAVSGMVRGSKGGEKGVEAEESPVLRPGKCEGLGPAC